MNFDRIALRVAQDKLGALTPIYTRNISPQRTDDRNLSPCGCGGKPRVDRDFRHGFLVYCPKCHLHTSDAPRARYESEAVAEWEVEVAHKIVASSQRYCTIFKTVKDTWYLDLASREYGNFHDCTTYGPFYSEQKAIDFLDDNFSNPGGWMTDARGTVPVPVRSPNGTPVQRPRSNNSSFGHGL